MPLTLAAPRDTVSPSRRAVLSVMVEKLAPVSNIHDAESDPTRTETSPSGRVYRGEGVPRTAVRIQHTLRRCTPAADCGSPTRSGHPRDPSRTSTLCRGARAAGGALAARRVVLVRAARIVVNERLEHHTESRRIGDRVQMRCYRPEEPDRLSAPVLFVGEHTAEVDQVARGGGGLAVLGCHPRGKLRVPIGVQQPVGPPWRGDRWARLLASRDAYEYATLPGRDPGDWA